MARKMCLTLVVCALAGCSLFNRTNDSVAQQFLEALAHGNGVKASQIWLQMTPAERQSLAHSQNPSPRNSVAAAPVKLQPNGSPDEDQTGGVVNEADFPLVSGMK